MYIADSYETKKKTYSLYRPYGPVGPVHRVPFLEDRALPYTASAR
jgi:hypothetical protein